MNALAEYLYTYLYCTFIFFRFIENTRVRFSYVWIDFFGMWLPLQFIKMNLLFMWNRANSLLHMKSVCLSTIGRFLRSIKTLLINEKNNPFMIINQVKLTSESILWCFLLVVLLAWSVRIDVLMICCSVSYALFPIQVHILDGHWPIDSRFIHIYKYTFLGDSVYLAQ